MTGHLIPDAAMAFIRSRLCVMVDERHIDQLVMYRLCAKTDFGECWIWGGYTRSGYGSLSISGRQVRLPRISLAWRQGEVVHSALHHCDEPRCWHPDHLFDGTQADNVADAVVKGRNSPPPVISGELHHSAVLTDIEVRQLRSIHGWTQRSLSELFDCSRSTVWRLRNRECRA